MGSSLVEFSLSEPGAGGLNLVELPDFSGFLLGEGVCIREGLFAHLEVPSQRLALVVQARKPRRPGRLRRSLRVQFRPLDRVR